MRKIKIDMINDSDNDENDSEHNPKKIKNLNQKSKIYNK